MTAHQVLLYCQTFDCGFSPVSWEAGSGVRLVVLARVTVALWAKNRTSPMARARVSAVMNKSLGVDRSRNVRFVRYVVAFMGDLLSRVLSLQGPAED
jgi:hypothetical protein